MERLLTLNILQIPFPHVGFLVTCSNWNQFGTSLGKWNGIFNHLRRISYTDLWNIDTYTDTHILLNIHFVCWTMMSFKLQNNRVNGPARPSLLPKNWAAIPEFRNCTMNPPLTDTQDGPGNPEAWICSTMQGAFFVDRFQSLWGSYCSLKPRHTSVSEIRIHFLKFLRSCHLRFFDKGWVVLARE